MITYVESETSQERRRNYLKADGTAIRGVHEPLISEDLFADIQKILKGHAPHQLERDDFILRGFVRCGKCGKNLTAGFATGRSQKYRRYWCWVSSCKAVNIRAESLEGQFASLIGLIQPEAELLAELPKLAAHAWNERKTRIAVDSNTLMKRLDDQRVLKEKAIKAKLMGELTEEDFLTLKKSVDGETTRIEQEIQALDSEKSSMEDLMKQTQVDVLDFRES